ncbi:hypothetical protein SAMN02800694_1455 [Luteibacter sp. UNCMF331Sha3.1]|nr:hypothetical protein SAMN02800694_1455 [Luteibacter sp. UNCMF331Sha3.1]
MDLYENTVIGTLLYGLGVEIGTRLGDGPLASAVSLLQQTPLDKSLADVLLQSPSMVRLIEFKRSGNADPKEAKKRRSLEVALKAEPDVARLQTVGLKVHWLVESSPRPQSIPTITASPYLGGPGRALNLQQLCEELAVSMVDPRALPTSADCAAYLQVVYKALGPLTRRTGGGGGGAVVLSFRGGNLSFEHLPDISDFFRVRHEIETFQASLNQAIDRARLEQDARITKDIQRHARRYDGPELG